MLFNSFEFQFLVLCTMALYYMPGLQVLQRFVLIGSSFVFYAANQPILLLLLIGSIAINIGSSHLVYHGRHALRTTYAALGVIANLGVLAFFKYSPLFGRTLFDGEGSLGEFLIAIPLPIGISFFTFQGITLLIDTLRVQEHRATYALPHGPFSRHTINTTLFISFFPQLVAGPIVKAHDFVPQINPKFLKDVDWAYCFRHLVTGYFLKMVVADNLKDQTFWIAYPYFESRSSTDLIVMLFGYSMQIFADFAGYSLIAIGTAGLFGYLLPQNFNFPYISKSIAEFWQRWHISLSSFLKEYLYFPLGGNKKGQVRTYINLMVVMLLGGLWHGAAWSYMVWGGAHGLALATERFITDRFRLPDTGLWGALRMLLVFLFVTYAWLLFKLPEFDHVIAYTKAIRNNGDLHTHYRLITMVLLYSLPVIAYHLHHLYRERLLRFVPASWTPAPAAYGLMLFLILANSGSPGAFVYFQF
ncbi:MAG: MBOAT family O-acyltransferase [Leptospirillia bacterium]